MKVTSSAIFAFALAAPSAAAFSASRLPTALSAATMDKVDVEADVKEAPSAESKIEEKRAQFMDSWALDPKNRVQAGRYNDKENSIALPFLKRPNKLDGSHAGDYGFDPLGFTESQDLYVMQEAELRHARLAMLAVIGWPLSELSAPEWMLQNGCAPSVLNGFNPLSFLATAAIFGAIGFAEYKTSLRRVDNTRLGKKHAEDMANVWEWGVAGDYNFDPLGLYSILGDDALGRKGLRELEISHGRSAMLGITTFAAWEALTGHPIVENSMFFHPNLLLPVLFAGYVAATQIFEFKESDQYIGLQVSSEGQARLENLKMSVDQAQANSKDTIEKVEVIAEKTKLFFADVVVPAAKDLKEKYDSVNESYTDNVMQKIKED